MDTAAVSRRRSRRSAVPAPGTVTWVPDVLGDGWEQTTLELGEDTDGPVVATLVRAAPGTTREQRPLRAGRPAVLYVHGFNDYFFQTHLATALRERGYAFYGLDLRRCGRSWRPWQLPNYVADLHDHVGELDAAAQIIHAQLGHSRLVVMGHSTGGLIASLWAHSRRASGLVDALVLNSPWVELNESWFHRTVVTRVIDLLGPLRPHQVLRHRESPYTRHLHVNHGGAWSFDLAWKPVREHPVRAAWLRTVRRGHARLARGLEVGCPVLICTSDSSGPDRDSNPDLGRQDTVLDVRHMHTFGPRVGPDTTVAVIEGGLHDLALSAEAPREEYLATVTDWLDATLPGHR